MSTMTMPAGPLAPMGAVQPEQHGVCADESLYEIVNGQRVELPPTSIFAVSINAALHLRLGSFVVANKLGRVVPEGKFILDAAKKFQRKPDLSELFETPAAN